MFGEPIDPATGAHMGSAHPQLAVAHIRASGKFALLNRMLERLFREKTSGSHFQSNDVATLQCD